MAAIKKFFEKRKLDIKFKQAGEGHKLTPESSASSSAVAATKPTAEYRQPAAATAEQRMAADAALARFNQAKAGSAPANKTAAVKTQVQQELLGEQRAMQKAMATAAHYASGPLEVNLEAAPVAGKVLFRCPLIGDEVRLPKEQMETAIEDFLLSQLADEPAMTSALMICTLNQSTDAVKQCIETIGKYLDNIASHPDEEKYRKIRLANKVLQEKVLALRGAHEFLLAAGFKKISLDGVDGNIEEVFIFAPDDVESVADYCTEMKELLNGAERIKPELDRDVKVFQPSPNAARIAVPEEFYRVSPEEIKREQQARTEAVEQYGMLRTRQMRERDRIKELRRYRYCLIRVRFPDGIILQGTFSASDRLEAVMEFVRDSIVNDWIPYYLSTSTGSRLDDTKSTLAELELAPASLLMFSYDSAVLNDIAAAQGTGFVNSGPYLKPHLMGIIASL